MRLDKGTIVRLIAGREAAEREFIAGNGEFSLNQALVEDGVPVLGIVPAPALAKVLAAGSGSRWRRWPHNGSC